MSGGPGLPSCSIAFKITNHFKYFTITYLLPLKVEDCFVYFYHLYPLKLLKSQIVKQVKMSVMFCFPGVECCYLQHWYTLKNILLLSIILFFFFHKEAVFLVLSIILFCAWRDYVERALTSPPFTAEEQTAPVRFSYCFLSKVRAKHGSHFIIVFML